MGKLSNQLFQNVQELVIKARKPRQQLVDALDRVLINQCPDGVVTSDRMGDADRLSEVICYLDNINFNETINGFTVDRLRLWENIHSWIENRKKLLDADTKAYLLSGYTVKDLYDTVERVLPQEFKNMLDKENVQDMSERIDRERELKEA